MIALAPWKLSGCGFVIMLRRSALEYEDGRPLEGHGRVTYLLCMHYETSGVGPYREVLLIPGRSELLRPTYTISRILVDSGDSLESGRANWGIPKYLGELDWRQEGRHMELTTQVGDSEDVEAGFHGHAAVRTVGPSVPFNTRPIPIAFLHTLDDKTFRIYPSASGWSSLAKVESLDMDGFGGVRTFPKEAVISAFAVSRFSMRFPTARIT